VKNGYISAAWDNRNDFFVSFPVFWYGCLAGIFSHYIKLYDVKVFQKEGKIKSATTEVITYSILLKIFFANEGVALSYFEKVYPIQFQSEVTNAVFYSFLLFFLDVTKEDCSLGRFTSHGWIYCIGDWSYSIYLIHYGILILVQQNTELVYLEATTLCVFLSILAGFLLNKLIEAPSVKCGAYVIKQLEKLCEYMKKIYYPLLETCIKKSKKDKNSNSESSSSPFCRSEVAQNSNRRSDGKKEIDINICTSPTIANATE